MKADDSANQARARAGGDPQEILLLEQAVPSRLIKIGEAVDVILIAQMLAEGISLSVARDRHGALRILRLHFVERDQEHQTNRAAARPERPGQAIVDERACLIGLGIIGPIALGIEHRDEREMGEQWGGMHVWRACRSTRAARETGCAAPWRPCTERAALSFLWKGAADLVSEARRVSEEENAAITYP